jgi:hypothetical protein
MSDEQYGRVVPRDDLESELRDLLEDLKSQNRKGRVAEWFGSTMVMVGSVSLIMEGLGLAADRSIPLGLAVGLIGFGLLLEIRAVRYFLTAATMPATRLANLHFTAGA